MTLLQENKKLLKEFRAGRSRAVREVYIWLAPRASRYLASGFTFQSQGQLFRMAPMQSAFERDDFFQEAATRAFTPKSRKSYDPTYAYCPWFQKILRNCVIDSYRRGKIQTTVLVMADDVAAPDQSSAENRELAVAVRKLYQRCGKQEKELIRLRFEEGVSQREAALRLSLTRSRIRSKEQAIRKYFYEALVVCDQLPDFLCETQENTPNDPSGSSSSGSQGGSI